MPLYEYQCDACGHRFELIQKFSDPAPAACTACTKGPMRRLQSSPAIQFKGSGWYITDYARKGSGESAGSAKSPDSSESKTSPSPASDAGPKTDSGSKSESAAPSAPAATETKT